MRRTDALSCGRILVTTSSDCERTVILGRVAPPSQARQARRAPNLPIGNAVSSHRLTGRPTPICHPPACLHYRGGHIGTGASRTILRHNSGRSRSARGRLDLRVQAVGTLVTLPRQCIPCRRTCVAKQAARARLGLEGQFLVGPLAVQTLF
jgi:hypothetical protein